MIHALGFPAFRGGLLAWAVYDRIALIRRGDTGAAKVDGFKAADAIVIAIGTVAYFAVFWLHDTLIGVTAA